MYFPFLEYKSYYKVFDLVKIKIIPSTMRWYWERGVDEQKQKHDIETIMSHYNVDDGNITITIIKEVIHNE